MRAPTVVRVLIHRIERDTDLSILWLCLDWLLQRYREGRDAETATLARLQREPDPELRKGILRLVLVRLSPSDAVRRRVARIADGDPDQSVRVEALATLAELERLRGAPPPPAPTSRSTRLLEAWAALETSLRPETS